MRDYEINPDGYNNLVALVEKKISEEEKLAIMYEKCAQALKSYQGKVINVRIEKAFNLTGYKARYGKYYNLPSLYISREYIGSDGETYRSEHYQINLCEKSMNQQRFDMAFMVNKSKQLRDQASKDRQEAARICEIVNKFNSALLWYRKAQEELQHIPHFWEWSKY